MLVWKELGTNPLLQAHNGYLEMYLNGGLVGLFLLAAPSCFRLECGGQTRPRIPTWPARVVFWPMVLFVDSPNRAVLSGRHVVRSRRLVVVMNGPWEKAGDARANISTRIAMASPRRGQRRGL